jgi:hypothetical protein
MNKTETIKRKIRKQFGTISNFARQKKLNRYDLQKMFAKRNPSEDELAGIELHLNGPGKVGVMTAQKFAKLKSAIRKAGGVKKFCADHPDFSEDTVFKILAKNRKMISGVVEKLLNHFNL